MVGSIKHFGPITRQQVYQPEDCEISSINYPGDRFLGVAETVELIRSSCPIAEPFVLLAESFSAPIAIHYAASTPIH